ALVAAFDRIPALYIADGHHRAASAARARAEIRSRRLETSSLGDSADYNTMLSVAFPHDQVQILPYNRVVRDLDGMDSQSFQERLHERFDITAGSPTPTTPGAISMYFSGRWSSLRPRTRADGSDRIAALDVSVLQDQLLAPMLHILDVRTDKRVDFVG